MFLNLVACCLLLCCSCSFLELNVPTLQVHASAPVTPAPVSNKVYLFGDVGNINRFVEPVTLSRAQLDDSTNDFACSYSDGNSTVYGIEWVLSSASYTLNVDNDLYSITVDSVTFQPYHVYATQYGSSSFSYAPCKFVCTYLASSPYVYSWGALPFDFLCLNSNAPSSTVTNTVYGMSRTKMFTTTGAGPYKMRFNQVTLDGSTFYSPSAMMDILVSSYASATSSIAREYNYNAAYGEGYDAGLRVGDAAGYSRGYADGADAANQSMMVVPTLFGAIANVPIAIFGGMGDLAIWNVPIISIIFTFLFLALVLWLVRKFI